MKMTKNARRLMTMMMAFALLLSGLSFSPAKAQAAEAVKPSVEVKGATLRLDASDGHQSMRIGIEVQNMDQAKNCGIKITNLANNKSVTVSTDAGYTNIYEADLKSNKLIYTTVITDIPASAYNTNFKIEGFVTDMEDAAYNTSGNIQKNVTDIIESIRQEIKGSWISKDGTLCNTVDEVDLENDLTKDNEVFAWGGGTNTKLKLGEKGNTAVYSDGKITVNGSLAYSSGAKQPGKYCISAEVSSSSGATIKLTHMNKGKEIEKIQQASAEKQKLEGYITFEELSYPAFSISGTGEFEITSLKIGKVLTNEDLNDNFKYSIAEVEKENVGRYNSIISLPLDYNNKYGEKTLGDFEKVIIEYSTDNADVELKVAIEKNGAAFAKYGCKGANCTIEIPFSDAGKDQWGGENYKDNVENGLAIPVKDAILNIVPTVETGFSGKLVIKSITLVEK